MKEIVIKANNLTKQYKKSKVVDDVSFEIKQNAIYGLIGPNGAGKTTIMKMLGGLVFPTEGEISLFGEKSEKGQAEARKRMSFIIETPYAIEAMSAWENLERQRIQKGIPDKEAVNRVLKLVGLENTGKKKVSHFSLGMRQRLGIAIALLGRPEVMILDEPINGLDPKGIIEIRELLLKLNKEENVTIIISSHILSELALLCTDYIFVNKGKILNSMSAEDLRRECKRYLHIDTNNNDLAIAILQEKLEISDYDVNEDGSIKIYEKYDDKDAISKTLFENGVRPTEMREIEANLEQFYMNMVEEGADEHN